MLTTLNQDGNLKPKNKSKFSIKTKLENSEKLTNLKKKNGKERAGEQNRTVVASLEGWCFTTKLHPHVGHAGFEPATPGSQNQYASQTALMTAPGKSQCFHRNRGGILSKRLNLVNDRN